MQFFIVFFQRLFSSPTQAEVKTAYVELGQVLALGAAVYAAVKSKDISGVLAQGDNLYLAVAALVMAVGTVWRQIFSSNVKAIANPKLPLIVGAGNHPINVGTP